MEILLAVGILVFVIFTFFSFISSNGIIGWFWLISTVALIIHYIYVKKKIREIGELSDKKLLLEENITSNISTLSDLQKEAADLEDAIEELKNIEFVENFEVYSPVYNLNDSAAYSEKLKECRSEQKEMMKDKKAAICETEWIMNNSKREGQVHINAYIKLILKAFNGECDSLISKVKFNNFYKISERIEKAHINFNKIAEKNKTSITDKYLKLKLEELHLVYEYTCRLQEEKEEQKAIREQMREEEKVRKEMEKEQADAEQAEQSAQEALEKAKKELAGAHGEEVEKLEEQLRNLEEKLKEAHMRKERAISMAELTRAGHVYVISNIGSFGEGVYKIGMTRRLEPMDRVKELGDASVPFAFDVHAMIYSEDAPSLEKTLHNKFDNNRLNKINYRKEFFRTNLEEIAKEAKKHSADFVLTKIAEAREYRETKLLQVQ
jgi:tetratricopeptide (TPR) repeat protein